MKFCFKSDDIIKIPGKAHFDDLSLKEVALMIEADSSICQEGNDCFSSNALDEFLHNTSLSRSDLKAIQQDILANIYVDVEGSKNKKINIEYLLDLSKKLNQDEE